MTPRPALVHNDVAGAANHNGRLNSEPQSKQLARTISLQEQDAKILAQYGTPGRFMVGDLIRARSSPSIQGVVLGKSKGKEGLRVLLAPYLAGSATVAAGVVDVPAGIIPHQGVPLSYLFWNPTAVQNYVHYLTNKGPLKREQETLLVDWANSRDDPEDSVFSAASELSFTGISSPGMVKARVLECEKSLGEKSSSLSSSSAVGLTDAQALLTSPDMLGNRSEIRTRSVEAKASAASSDPTSSKPSPPASSSASMAPTQVADATLQTQFQEFRAEMRQQLKEMSELIVGVARRQKTVEDRIKESASSSAAQWEELDLRLNSMSQRPEGNAEPSHVRERPATLPVDEGEPDWLIRGQRRDEPDWQVNVRQGGRALNASAEEVIECPFSLQPRRNDGFRVQRAHRRAHRRLLEDIYGANDSAVAAAHSILGQMDKDTRSPSWEAACLLQVAKGLDIVLLEHCDGMWSQWNQPVVDFFARFYFEMVGRIRPDEDVAQLMQPDLQKRLRELNFGKQRAYGPVMVPQRFSRNWRSAPQTGSPKPNAREGGSFPRKQQWSSTDKSSDSAPASSEGVTGQGAWLWQPGHPPGKPGGSFRPDPPSVPRPPQ